jgi:hypothetical protein
VVLITWVAGGGPTGSALKFEKLIVDFTVHL